MTTHFDRRAMLRGLGWGLVAAPFLPSLLGCGGSSSSVVDAALGSDGGVPDVAPGAWASGGTASMTDKASYPDPFTTAPSMCALVATTTEGPCTTATDLAREDISEGGTGLPVRLALRIVDAACNPIANAAVKVWQTDVTGSYSGQTPNNGFCLKDSAYAAKNFGRGVQTTTAAGIVYFDTVFPGWYSGRAIHIHFQIKNGNTSTKVSQLFFPEALTTEIFSAHTDYKAYGQPNTRNSNDNIVSAIPAAQRDRLILEYARMTDGAMLASKTVTVTG